MVPWWSIILAIAVVVLGVSLPMILDFWGGTKTKRILAGATAQANMRFVAERREILAELQRHGTRYEIRVRDWGEQYGTERWRWAIFDADALLATWAGSEAPLGAEMPFESGNAATRIDAEMQALAAIERQTNPIKWGTGHEPEVSIVTRGVGGPHGSVPWPVGHFPVSREVLGLGPDDA